MRECVRSFLLARGHFPALLLTGLLSFYSFQTDGLVHPSAEKILEALEPVRKAIEELDAESFLKLEPVKKGGARLMDG